MEYAFLSILTLTFFINLMETFKITVTLVFINEVIIYDNNIIFSFLSFYFIFKIGLLPAPYEPNR